MSVARGRVAALAGDRPGDPAGDDPELPEHAADRVRVADEEQAGGVRVRAAAVHRRPSLEAEQSEVAEATGRRAFLPPLELCTDNAAMIAAAACEIHPRALLKGAGLRSIADKLSSASAEAPAQVPAIVIAE